jgi:hypothetical protein
MVKFDKKFVKTLKTNKSCQHSLFGVDCFELCLVVCRCVWLFYLYIYISYTMGTGGPFAGDKARPGRDADHSLSSSAKVKYE